MATYGWGHGASVAEGLAREGHRFDFYQAVRILEMMDPEAAGVGIQDDPEREVVRFSSRVRMDYPATDVDSVGLPQRHGEPARMTINFLGLAGALGPLPNHLSESLLRRLSKKDPAMGDFLDIFNHRLASLMFRARKKVRVSLQDRPPDNSRVARTLFSLMGLGLPRLKKRMRIRDRSLLPAAGLLAREIRPIIGLERLVTGHFRVPARVEPFDGRWFPLEPGSRTHIGRGRRGRNQVLGDNAVLGRRVWIQDAAYRLHLGPLDLSQYLDLLPVGGAFPKLCELARFYAGDELGMSVRLILRAAEVPRLRLGRAGDSRLGWSSRLEAGPGERSAEARLGRSGSARLGWTSWLRGEHTPKEDATLTLRAEGFLATLDSGEMR